MLNTTGSRLPEIVYSTSFISTRPWPEVKLVTRPPASGETFAERGGRVLAFRLEEDQLIAPQVRHAVHHGRVEPAAHRRRTGDRIGARSLGDASLDVDDGFGAVAGGGDAGVLELVFQLVPGGNVGNAVKAQTLSSGAVAMNNLLPGVKSEPKVKTFPAGVRQGLRKRRPNELL